MEKLEKLFTQETAVFMLNLRRQRIFEGLDAVSKDCFNSMPVFQNEQYSLLEHLSCTDALKESAVRIGSMVTVLQIQERKLKELMEAIDEAAKLYNVELPSDDTPATNSWHPRAGD